MSEQPDEMVDAYLRHLLQGGEAPDLAGMDARERTDLERTFTLLDAIAGIDPELVPPYEDDAVARALGLSPPAPASDVADTRRRITREIERLRRGAPGPPPRARGLGWGAVWRAHGAPWGRVGGEPGTMVETAARDFDGAVVAAETATDVVRRLKEEAVRARIPAKGIAFAALGNYEIEEL